jgi:hypothetical protein
VLQAAQSAYGLRDVINTQSGVVNLTSDGVACLREQFGITQPLPPVGVVPRAEGSSAGLAVFTGRQAMTAEPADRTASELRAQAARCEDVD